LLPSLACIMLIPLLPFCTNNMHRCIEQKCMYFVHSCV
jgi:hypothetical protein